MKRFFALSLALICMFSTLLLTSCNETAYQLYTDGVKELTDATALDAKMTVAMTMKTGSTSNQSSTTMDIKTNGNDMTIASDTMDVTYVGGVVYMNLKLGEFSSKTKTTATVEEAKELTGDYTIDTDEVFPALTEKDLENVKVEKNGDKRTITADLSDAAVKKLSDKFSNSITGGVEENAPTITVSDVKMTASFDKDGHIVDFNLKFNMAASVMGMDVSMNIDLKMEINAINGSVSITAPADAADYEEISPDDSDEEPEV